MYNANQHRALILVLILFILPISGLSIDIYVPSLPTITDFFGCQKFLVQMSITIFMVGMGLMQFFAGAITDSFGRRTPILVGMPIYILATALIPWAPNIYCLLVLRLLEGLAIGLFAVPLRAILPDLYEGKALHKTMSYVVIAWSIGPIIAPVIGGYLQHYFGWSANFYFLTIYSLIAFLCTIFLLPETTKHRHEFSIKTIGNNSKEILSSFEYWRGVLSDGLLYSIMILYAVLAPFFLSNQFHFSAIEIGHASLFVGLGWFTGAMINRFTLQIDLFKKIKFTLLSMLVVTIISILLNWIFSLNIYLLIPPVFLLAAGGGIIFPNYFGRGMALFPNKTGSANAFMGGFIFVISGLSSSFGSLLKSNSSLPLMFSYMGITIICLFLLWGARLKNSDKL